MQVFIPYNDFFRSTSCLDKTRLGNQVYREGITLLRGKWPNHPAGRMFTNYQGRDYRYSLCNYLLSGINALESRNLFYPTIKAEIINAQAKYRDIGNPPWLGDERFHSSHRSKLLFKGRVDSVCEQLKKHLKVRSINKWLKSNGYPEKNYFKHPDIERLESYSRTLFTLTGYNYYSKFGWSEDDTQDYYWPVRINLL